MGEMTELRISELTASPAQPLASCGTLGKSLLFFRLQGRGARM